MHQSYATPHFLDCLYQEFKRFEQLKCQGRAPNPSSHRTLLRSATRIEYQPRHIRRALCIKPRGKERAK